jgi:AcrR family transcriptional regulator
MPKPRGRNPDLYAATHGRILAAARALFAARGFDAVATPELATAAGVAQGSLFHHFGSKRDLFIAVHDAVQLELIGRIDAAAAVEADPWRRFGAIWRAYLDATADEAIRRVLLLDGPRVIGLEALRARDRETAFAFLLGEVQGLQALGLLPGVPARALAVLLFGALDQAAFEMADFPRDQALRAALVEAVGTMMEALKKG